MKIYTKTGDSGTTGLIGGARELKSSCTFHAIGDLDEANGVLGVCIASITRSYDDGSDMGAITTILNFAQNHLFEIGSELASPASGSLKYNLLPAGAEKELETSIDQLNEVLPPLANFILPGGSNIASQLHLARTVVRRAERSIIALDQVSPVSANIKAYMNRLSDWLFMAARYANLVEGEPEVTWGAPIQE